MDLTTALNSSMDIEFQDVCYSVVERKNFVQEAGRRVILDNVSGAFRSGQLSAIMGPSGAGKSSLLNAISGYRTSGVSGFIKVNKKNSAYITQEDHHQTLLTVYELMRMSCALKLKDTTVFDDVITDILTKLHLDHRKTVTADKLSGGERKRLSIALELVSKRSIFFLDEPTSGLDEVTSRQCIQLLRTLAQQGLTIVCTIHQPSANIFNLFDSLFVLAKGKCVYQGAPGGLVSFMSGASLECPKHYTPCDYIIEVCDSEDGKYIPFLADVVQNGKLMYSPADQYSTRSVQKCTKNDADFKSAITALFIENQSSNNSGSCFGATGLLEKMKLFSKRMKEDNHTNSRFTQFTVLLRVMMLKICRNKFALWIQFFHHFLCGILFGLIFLNGADDGSRMFDHLKYCIGLILVIVYTQVMIPVLSYPYEIKLVQKEYFNRWYNLSSYYFAMTISRLPFQILFNIVFLSLTYWMTGLPAQYWRFLLFLLVGNITSLAAEGMGLAIGATFNVTNGAIVGPFIIACYMGLAIYGFDFASEIPMFMYAIMKISYFRVGAVTMVLIVFGFDRPQLYCNDIYCHFSDPKVILRFLDIEKVSVWTEILFLILCLLFFRALIYVSLSRKCKT